MNNNEIGFIQELISSNGICSSVISDKYKYSCFIGLHNDNNFTFCPFYTRRLSCNPEKLLPVLLNRLKEIKIQELLK